MLSHFEFTAQDLPHDFHAVTSLTFDELCECGFVDWAATEWQWDAYDGEQRERMQRKIRARYGMREIGILPWAEFRRQLVRKLDEVMPKYKLLYKKISDSAFDPFLAGDDHGKERRVFSDFPATLLDPENGDYAANATDREYEDRHEGDTLAKIKAISDGYADVDVLVLDELEPLFSSLMTVNFNGF